MTIRRMSSRSNANELSRNADSSLEIASGVAPKRGMVLPFTPLAMSFDSVNYYVDMPQVRDIYFPSTLFMHLKHQIIFQLHYFANLLHTNRK